MSKNTLKEFRATLLENQKTKLLQKHFYRVTFDNVGSIIDTDDFAGDEEFDLYCQATSLPNKSMEALEVKKHGFTFRFPSGVINYDGSWSTTILLDVSMEGYKKLLNWFNHYSNLKNGGAGERGFPTATASVHILDNQLQDIDDAIMTIYGIFPTSVPSVELSQEDPEHATIDVEFAYSYTDDMAKDNPLQ